jgi:hypothetical protein
VWLEYNFVRLLSNEYNSYMNRTVLRQCFGIILILASSALLVWGVWDFKTTTRVLDFQQTDLTSEEALDLNIKPTGTLLPLSSFPKQTAPGWKSSEILDGRVLILEWSPTIRVGDSEVIRLSLDMLDDGRITPTMAADYETFSGDVQIPSIYESHYVTAEVRLDISGMQISPGTEIIEAVRPSKPVTFYWNVSPEKFGDFRGTVWLHLHFIPIGDEGGDGRIPISAQIIQIRAINLLGMSGKTARILGLFGILVGSVLGIDNNLPWFWKKLCWNLKVDK